jgi:2-hydroxymuconate-semialdehyde hydrolase
MSSPSSQPIPGVHSRFVMIGQIRTHYLEAGEGPPLVLLHSGEFGGCAELTWEHTIAPLARHFHVYAPDWLGYGKTDKLFSFDDMWGLRVRHIADFLRTMCIDRAHFIGNSMGGTMLLAVAAMAEPAWPLDRIIAVCGGGAIPDNEARQALNSYDGSREHMRRIVEAMFVNPSVRADDAYIDRRHRISLEPGAWECTAAARFKRPGRDPRVALRPGDEAYGNIAVPTLIVAGAKDALRDPGYGPALQADIPGSELYTVAEAGHCPQIDAHDEFNRVAIEFLLRA